jgi:hypothetical protein
MSEEQFELHEELPAFQYNSTVRNNGTARRVRDAAVRMFGKKLSRYSRPAEIEAKHPLCIFVDDGRDDLLDGFPPSPSACYLIDTHLGYTKRLEWARQFDAVFLAQLPDVDKMKKDGVDNVHWLPLACHPPVDPNADEIREYLDPSFPTEPVYDCCFVGFLNDDKEGNSRIDYLDRLIGGEGEFPNSHFAFSKFFEETAKRYCRAKIGFHISIRRDLAMRWFECLSYGVPLLTNRTVDGWQELGFVDGEHFIGFTGKDEMIEKAHWILDHPEEAQQVAKEGHEFVREHHTYTHRMKHILEVCGVKNGSS